MKSFELYYEVFRNNICIYGDYADVNISDLHLFELSTYILTNHSTGEMSEIPSHIYDSIAKKVSRKATKKMKEEHPLNYTPEDRIVMQPVFPPSLLGLFTKDVRKRIDKTKIDSYYSMFDNKKVENDSYKTDPSIVYVKSENCWHIEKREAPNKENTLYHPTNQTTFNQIVSGKKTTICRDIKPSTYQKFIESDVDGFPYSEEELLSKEYNDLDSDICTWNNGIYPFIPKTTLHYISLSAGFSNDSDSALVEIDSIRFSPVLQKNGHPMRFTREMGKVKFSDKGQMCFWMIEFHIKRIVKLRRKMAMKIYVASSWRNEFHPDVVNALREAGHEVYDFRNPPSGGNGFRWSDISPDYADWTPDEYKANLSHVKANEQFQNDIEAMTDCDACVLVLPCGRSAHTEAGWMAGSGKKVWVYMPVKQEPELMYKLFDGICTSTKELIDKIEMEFHTKRYAIKDSSTD